MLSCSPMPLPLECLVMYRIFTALLLCSLAFAPLSLSAAPQAPAAGEAAPASDLVNINTASAEELRRRLFRVGPALAARIVAARPFQSVEEITRVRGIGPRILEHNRAKMTVGPPAPSGR